MKAVALAAFVFLAASVVWAQTVYYDRTLFMADGAVAGGGTTDITFDSYAEGTDLTGQTVSGVTFAAPGSGPLTVLLGTTGVRYALSPSSGLSLLSPGGSNASLENDDLTITFAVPVRGAGLDVVFDVPDGGSLVNLSFYDPLDVLIAQIFPIPAPNGSPGYQFVGLVSTSANIKRIVFDEYDASPNDENVGYDSLVFTAIPEPAGTAGVVAAFVLGAVLVRRQRRKKCANQTAARRHKNYPGAAAKIFRAPVGATHA